MLNTQWTRRGWLVAALGVLCLSCAPSCVSTSLEVAPVQATDTLTVRARLTADGKPVKGAAVSFSVILVGPDNKEHGTTLGRAETDDNGVAVRNAGYLNLIGFPGERIVRYGAEFVLWERLNDVRYCDCRAFADITCAQGTCPARSS